MFDETCMQSGEPLVRLPQGLGKVFDPPADHATATAQLHEVHAWQADKGIRKRALQNWDETLERDLLATIRSAALEETDPVQRDLKLRYVENAGLAHRTRLAVEAKLLAATESIGTGAAMALPVDELKAYVALTESTLKMARQIPRWPRMIEVNSTNNTGAETATTGLPTADPSAPHEALAATDYSHSASTIDIFNP